MATDPAGDRTGGSGAAANSRWVVVAGLGGALIGALSGLAGSLLVYNQSEENQRIDAKQRQSDARRQGYVVLAAEFQAFKTEINSVRNFYSSYEYAAALPGNSEEDLRKRREGVVKRYNDKFVPAQMELMKAEVLVRMIGTERARGAVTKMVASRNKLLSPLSKAIDEWSDFNEAKFDASLKEYEIIVDGFIDKAEGDVF